MCEKSERTWIIVLVFIASIGGFALGRWTSWTEPKAAAAVAPAQDVKLTDQKYWEKRVVYPVDEDWGIEYTVYTGPGIPTFKKYVPLSDKAFAQMNPDQNKRTTPKIVQ